MFSSSPRFHFALSPARVLSSLMLYPLIICAPQRETPLVSFYYEYCTRTMLHITVDCRKDYSAVLYSTSARVARVTSKQSVPRGLPMPAFRTRKREAAALRRRRTGGTSRVSTIQYDTVSRVLLLRLGSAPQLLRVRAYARAKRFECTRHATLLEVEESAGQANDPE